MLISYSSDDVLAAKESEIRNWKNNGAYEEAHNNGQKAITVRWVVTNKLKYGKSITKARLVARGFEENTTSLRKDSPMCSK